MQRSLNKLIDKKQFPNFYNKSCLLFKLSPDCLHRSFPEMNSSSRRTPEIGSLTIQLMIYEQYFIILNAYPANPDPNLISIQFLYSSNRSFQRLSFFGRGKDKQPATFDNRIYEARPLLKRSGFVKVQYKFRYYWVDSKILGIWIS